ncbi:YeeE/YedE family protein [Colwellia sp. MB02u-18]|uniref:YeeE/YedE family protein n=1 Tax=unclassified Colwellia TaxID=196834 RepID=UPI0015F40F42|nr:MULTISPECIES: YeeE/YedE family protein [unclassified Colwellia]MBA6222829.1 YeeE/YedE family protein [Colwellia sp. MB3u-45]MBA6266581.1 YeeE/YedE family protein [Colwellia sp. MB3u-43]MBA6320404.1 YeeE/YedE family protein [Colwellia sp. MB02u-19]MBA6323286.1 YeeE/YedE family protein [Colwellia sp. MB02u-18]MBA6329789.1 YeeE/YedE family protein [Colwellia sp. MB02u-12]
MENIYIQALMGGGLIGVASLLLMLFNGRVAGVSGITHGAITSLAPANWWRWLFLVGLIIAPLITALFGYGLPTSMPVGLPQLAIAGLIVGVGTHYGSGCTSGHGICGIGRLSKRSLVATLTFMLSAIVTVAVINHVIG